MRTLSFALILFNLICIFGLELTKSKPEYEDFGCRVPDGKTSCCWKNKNACCSPYTRGGTCFLKGQTTCCKIKIYNPQEKKYKYLFGTQ